LVRRSLIELLAAPPLDLPKPLLGFLDHARQLAANASIVHALQKAPATLNHAPKVRGLVFHSTTSAIGIGAQPLREPLRLSAN
jgi:hypothetical protein